MLISAAWLGQTLEATSPALGIFEQRMGWTKICFDDFASGVGTKIEVGR